MFADPLNRRPWMTAENETELTLIQEVALVVREQSRTEATLTRMDSLLVDERPLSTEEQEDLAQQLLADEGCSDLRCLRGSSGLLCLYSRDFISDGYARILLRAEDGNPYETIAATVREESEIYPRPTPLAIFREPTFGLQPDRVEQLVEEMLQLEQYRDIKTIVATTGARYLYSERYLDGEWARSLVEWEEVERPRSL